MSFITPDWPTPSHIKSVVTTREGGFSKTPWDGLNLARHVDDDPKHVEKNRQYLKKRAGLPSEPEWLNQTHSTIAVNLELSANRHADASFTQLPKQIAVVLTADCLPLLITNDKGTEVAAIHAGWKGLLAGVVTKTLQQMKSDAASLLVWLGPAISQQHFEVGAEVKQQFEQKYALAGNFFKSHSHDKYLADLYGLARYELSQLGVTKVYGGDLCSYAQQDLFYSYRRDGVTGRMASMIWIAE